jgi:hypothetical protein
MPLTDLVAQYPTLPLWQPIRLQIMEDAVYEEMCTSTICSPRSTAAFNRACSSPG